MMKSIIRVIHLSSVRSRWQLGGGSTIDTCARVAGGMAQCGVVACRCRVCSAWPSAGSVTASCDIAGTRY